MSRIHPVARPPHALTRAFLVPLIFCSLCAAGCQQLPPHVLRVNGKVQPAPGYTFLSNPEKDLKVRWSPGTPHPENPRVLAASAEGKWIPREGYTWVSEAEQNLQVKWNPGARSSIDSHRMAGANEGEWIADPGYTFVKAFPGDLRTQWASGRRHPNHAHMVSSETEGQWSADPGYRWDGTQAVWTPGQGHPLHPHVQASDREGTWRPEQGYQWVSSEDASMEVAVADEETPLQHLVKAVVLGAYGYMAQKASEPQEGDNLLQTLGRGVAGEVSGTLYQGAVEEAGKALGR